MIENEELGLKVAESKGEELWHKVVKAREFTIQNLEESLIVEREFLKTARKRLEEEKKKVKVSNHSK